MKSTPAWVDRDLFPFESKWINIDGHEMHYVDEGQGETILFVHGTPEWSFGFRDQIRDLKTRYRCIAADHLGFGLSDKPGDGNYTVESHSKRLSEFIRIKNLTNITIVANDFGGGIALGYALADVDNIKSIILFNTWLWSLKNDSHYSKPAKTIDSWLGKFLYLRLNAPVNMIMPAAFGDRKKLTKNIHSHYRKAYPGAPSRVALYAIAKELMGASDWWQSLWDKADVLSAKPLLFMWGMKDKFIPPYEFEKWKKRFPGAQSVAFEKAGHFVQEEENLSAVIEKFLKS
jgi:pimeloyl-ACP methyl ester carboxylesterase